jgi:hypothetical protein
LIAALYRRADAATFGRMIRTLVLVVASTFALCACPPKPAADQLPPPGLAGSPSTSKPLALPGAGFPVADPSGTTSPTSSLPPGHPPIPGAADGNNGMPAGHPPMPTGPDAPATADASVTITGPVLETMDVPEYTYMRVKSGVGDTWVAVTKTPVAVGDVVTVSQSLVMTDFFSKGLNRTFPKLVMGMLVGAPKKP